MVPGCAKLRLWSEERRGGSCYTGISRPDVSVPEYSRPFEDRTEERMIRSARFTGYRYLLSAYLRPQGRRVVLLGVLLAVGLGLELANPWILRAFIDSALAGASLASLTGIALAFLGVALATQLVTVAETYVAENVGLTATNRSRSDLTLHTLRLDPSFHGSHTPGELIERVDRD